MNSIKLLWADDEIDLLKPQILFLKDKGYAVTPVTNGQDAVDKIEAESFDIVFLDEQMPGLSGLEALAKIKAIKPHTPVVMITKSEEENVMEDAIGSKISDYLIKPVNPNQILLSIKKLLKQSDLISEKSTSNYQRAFSQISMDLMDVDSLDGWKEIYNKLVYWEMELENSNDPNIAEILQMQKSEANKAFSKFVKNDYESILNESLENDEFILSHNLMKTKIFPELEDNIPVFVVLIDNLRYDQWKTLSPIINKYFTQEEEDLILSIIPSTTHYSRNSIFAGLMPADIEKKHPEYWLNDEDSGGKNQYEAELLAAQLKRAVTKPVKSSYHKIYDYEFAKKVNNKINNLLQNDLNILVYNFVDMLSHARTDVDVIKELANDEKAYRNVTKSWFENSPLLDLLKEISEKKCKVIFITDHGTIRVKEHMKVIGDKETTTNLRYKHGRNMNYNPKQVLAATNPTDIKLPSPHINSKYIFAMNDKFMVYPNNYNHFANYYNNTFQHGGISLEEMIIPVVKFRS